MLCRHGLQQLEILTSEVFGKTRGDRSLVLQVDALCVMSFISDILQLIKAYAGADKPEMAVDLMDKSARLQDVKESSLPLTTYVTLQIGAGDHRVEILLEGVQALKKLGTEDDLQRAVAILDACVELVPSGETFGILSSSSTGCNCC